MYAPPLQFCTHSNGAADGTCCTAEQDAAIALEHAELIAASANPDAVSDACRALQVCFAYRLCSAMLAVQDGLMLNTRLY
jgi:hypothetical protein